MSRAQLQFLCKRARAGLYAGRTILSGNKVSEDGGNRSRRRWLPNVQGKSLYSEILDRTINLKVTTHALRCIDKAGGVKPLIASSIRLHGLLKIVRRRILRERHALDEGSLLHAGLDKYILNTREDKLYSDKGIMLKMEMLVKLSGRGGETEDAVTPAMSSPAT